MHIYPMVWMQLLASITGTQKISVPMTIVVSGIAKMFVGELVETGVHTVQFRICVEISIPKWEKLYFWITQRMSEHWKTCDCKYEMLCQLHLEHYATKS